MHSLFYFLAAAFLNIFFAKKIIFRHVVIFIFLILFGIAIEFAQEYSNKFPSASVRVATNRSLRLVFELNKRVT